MTERVIEITDPSDERVAAYRDIRERDLVGRQGRFVAEGKVVLTAALSQPCAMVDSAFILDRKLPDLAGLIAGIPDQIPVYSAASSVFDAMAGFHVHRGVLAIMRIPTAPTLDELLSAIPDRGVTLMLCGIANHDNMGAIFRNAAAFGADAVLLDDQCCDPYYRKAVRVSVGGIFKVPFARIGSARDAIERMKEHGFEAFGLSPAGSTALSDCQFAQRSVLVLGSEGQGLDEETLAATNTLRIPIARSFDSLNVATSAAIALHQYRIGAAC